MLARIKQSLLALHRDERGAMSVEKILILALISIPLITVLYFFRGKLVSWFQTQSNDVTNQAASQPNYQ